MPKMKTKTEVTAEKVGAGRQDRHEADQVPDSGLIRGGR